MLLTNQGTYQYLVRRYDDAAFKARVIVGHDHLQAGDLVRGGCWLSVEMHIPSTHGERRGSRYTSGFQLVNCSIDGRPHAALWMQ